MHFLMQILWYLFESVFGVNCKTSIHVCSLLEWEASLDLPIKDVIKLINLILYHVI